MQKLLSLSSRRSKAEKSKSKRKNRVGENSRLVFKTGFANDVDCYSSVATKDVFGQ